MLIYDPNIEKHNQQKTNNKIYFKLKKETMPEI